MSKVIAMRVVLSDASTGVALIEETRSLGGGAEVPIYKLQLTPVRVMPWNLSIRDPGDLSGSEADFHRVVAHLNGSSA